MQLGKFHFVQNSFALILKSTVDGSGRKIGFKCFFKADSVILMMALI